MIKVFALLKFYFYLYLIVVQISKKKNYSKRVINNKVEYSKFLRLLIFFIKFKPSV